MKNTPKSRMIVPHSKDCFMKDKTVPWSGIPIKQMYGNFAANRNVQRGRGHLWIVVSCNDPKCPAQKAVHCNVLAEG
jgi:hypothetical protein